MWQKNWCLKKINCMYIYIYIHIINTNIICKCINVFFKIWVFIINFVLFQIKSNQITFIVTSGQTVQKKQQTIYIWTDSAKKTALEHLQCSRQCKKTQQQQFTYGQTVQKKQQQQFTYGQTVQKNNSNLHMDSTYLQTVQKTMCKIHIHILSTYSVL